MFPFVLGVTQLCISMNNALSPGASTPSVIPSLSAATNQFSTEAEDCMPTEVCSKRLMPHL